MREAGEVLGYPLMLKAKRMAYDGKGNAPVMDEVRRYRSPRLLGGNEFDRRPAGWTSRGVPKKDAAGGQTEAIELRKLCLQAHTVGRIEDRREFFRLLLWIHFDPERYLRVRDVCVVAHPCVLCDIGSI